MSIRKITVIMAAVIGCQASSWNLAGGHSDAWKSGGITLGEISLQGHQHYKLPTIILGNNGYDEQGWKEWPGSAISQSNSGWLGNSVGHDEWKSSVMLGHGWEGKVIPIVKEIGIPVAKEVKIEIPHLVAETVPQPYPVLVPVPKPVPIEIVKTLFKTVEKKVPTPVERVVPVRVEKPVPFTVYKNVPYPVVEHVPIKIPVYKTVHHYSHRPHHHHHHH